MEVNEAKRMKELERENTELKKMLAEAMLDQKVLKYALEKNGLRFKGLMALLLLKWSNRFIGLISGSRTADESSKDALAGSEERGD